MNHFATSGFWYHYGRLRPEVRRLADKNFALLQQNSLHSSLRFKKVRANTWSVHIGLHYRAMAVERPNGMYWFWIGHHGEYGVILN